MLVSPVMTVFTPGVTGGAKDNDRPFPSAAGRRSSENPEENTETIHSHSCRLHVGTC